MDTKDILPNRRGFLKGLAVGVGGYALGSFLIHPSEVLGVEQRPSQENYG